MKYFHWTKALEQELVQTVAQSNLPLVADRYRLFSDKYGISLTAAVLKHYRIRKKKLR